MCAWCRSGCAATGSTTRDPHHHKQPQHRPTTLKDLLPADRGLALHSEDAATALPSIGGVQFAQPIWRGPRTETSTRVEVVVERHGSTTATIIGMSAVITKRAPRLAGAQVLIEPQGDGKVSNIAKLAIRLILNGQTTTLYATDDGHPFKSTAGATRYTATYRFNPTYQRFEQTKS